MGDRIGLWWNQNWYNVIGAAVFTIVLVAVTFYVFRNKKQPNHLKAGSEESRKLSKEPPEKSLTRPHIGINVVALLLSLGSASLVVFFFIGFCTGEKGVFVLQNWYFFVGFSFVCFALAFLLKE